MILEDYQKSIYNGLTSIPFDSGKMLTHYLSDEEIKELTTKLCHYIPQSHDMIINSIFRNVLSYIPTEIFQKIVRERENKLILKRISNNINIEEEKLLIFYMQLSLKLKTQASIHSSMEEVQEFFKSFIIDDIDMLQAEIITNPISGHTKEIKDYYVRYILEDYSLIPTIQTEEKFINYLNK